MRAVVQRVRQARVLIGDETVGQIDTGLLILVGVHKDDTPTDVRFLADKTLKLRIFPDADGKMNRSLIEIGGAALVVSQFTLYGDCSKGRRPSFIDAARPEAGAIELYEQYVSELRRSGIVVATGRFGADMLVELSNDGPVTLILDTPPRTS